MLVQWVILPPPDAGEGAKRPLRRRRRAKVGMGESLRGRETCVQISWGLI